MAAAVLPFSIRDRIRVTSPDVYDFDDDVIGLRVGDVGHVGNIWRAADATFYVCHFKDRYLPAGYYLRSAEIELAPRPGQLTL